MSGDALEDTLAPGEPLSECSDIFKSVSECFKASVTSVQTGGSNSVRQPLKSSPNGSELLCRRNFFSQFFPETVT